MSMTPLIYTVEQTAEILQVSRAQIFAELRTGRLGSYKIGRLRRIGQPHIDAFLSAISQDGPA